MPRAFTNPWISPAIRVAAAGLGAAVAGPLGGALGAWVGGAIGASAVELVDQYAEKFGDKAGEKLLETLGDSLAEKLKEPSLQFEGIYREALRLTLAEIQTKIRWEGFDDWFVNWETCLAGQATLKLSSIVPDQLVPENLDQLFRLAMERLDAQGAAMRKKSMSLILQTRAIPDALLFQLTARGPERLQENFRLLIVKPENDQAWKQAQLVFQDFASATLGRIEEKVKSIPQIADDTAVIRKIVEGELTRALEEGRIAREQEQAARAQVESLTAELQKLKQQVTGRVSEPGQAALSNLLASGDLEGALRVKTQQVEAQRGTVGTLAQDLFELGAIHELRFDWPMALEAFREAWTLNRDPGYGFKYAYLAQQQNHFQEAAGAYENVLTLYRELAKADPEPYLPSVAMTLNNLGNLYRATQRRKEAEEAYREALSTRRELANANPDAFLPDVSTTLNNLANLYGATQRMKEAEGAYREALSIRRELAKTSPEAYLPRVAATLNNLAILHNAARRTKEAEEAYLEALSTYRELAEVNSETYLPYVATTLNNLGILYGDTQRMKEAEEAYQKALSTYRELADINPEAYLSNVATTLNNLAAFYTGAQRTKEAEGIYQEALLIRRKLAESNPEAYLPDVAITLNNLGNLYRTTQRVKEAEECCREAEQLLDPLWQAHPELHGDQMARILWTLAQLCEPLGQSAKDACILAQRAFAAAYHPDLKQGAQELIDQFCTNLD